jgi:hypothetical protein
MAKKDLKSFLGQKIELDKLEETPELIVTVRHDIEKLNDMTKKELLAYVKKYDLNISSRKKKEEIIQQIIKS